MPRLPALLLALLAMATAVASTSQSSPSTAPDPVAALRAAVARGRTPPAAVEERPGTALGGKNGGLQAANGEK